MYKQLIFTILMISGILGFRCPQNIFIDNNNNARIQYSDVYFFEGVTPFPNGQVFFTDTAFSILSQLRSEPLLPVGRILRYDAEDDEVTVFEGNSGKAIGMCRDQDNNLITACGADYGERAIKRISRNSKLQKFISTTYNGSRYNSPNDVIVDSEGRILWTDPRYEGQPFESVDLPQGRVYSWDPTTNHVSVIISDLQKGNGLILSKDSSKLYVADSNNGDINLLTPPNPQRRQIREYLYSSNTGTAVFNRVVVDFNLTDPDDGGSADGLEIDDCGLLYVAYTRAGSGIRVYNITSGNHLYTINLGPSVIPVNLKFGQGRYRQTLYIVGFNFSFTDPRGLFYSIDLLTRGVNTPRS